MNRQGFFRITAILLCLCMLAVFSSCAKEQAQNYSPLIPDAPQDFYVYDEAGVLTEETENHILEQNNALFALSGAQIVVVCIQTTGQLDIADYARQLFNKWGIGSKEKNIGILLLLTIDEDDYWALQGEGLEDLLSSGTLKLMLNEQLEPHFSAKQYDTGVRTIFDELIRHLESVYDIDLAAWDGNSGEYTSTENESNDQTEKKSSGVLNFFIWAVIIVIVILFISTIASASGGNRGNRGGRGGGSPPRRRPIYTGHPHIGPHSGSYGGYIRPGGSFGGSRPGGNFGGSRPGGSFGGSRPGGSFGGSRPGGSFGGSRPGGSFGGSRPGGSFGGSRPGGSFGGSRPGGSFGGSRPGGNSGGGGFSRGGGAGRR